MKPLVASLVGVLLGCGPRVSSNSASLPAPGTFLITAEQIERSGVHTAWDVLKHDAPMLLLREDRNGDPASISRRGRTSFLLEEAPLVMLDGVRVPDFRALASIEAASITSITIYDGVESTTYYGTGAVAGVIAIKTKDGRPS
jgi:outer membrane cobalamin receptor